MTIDPRILATTTDLANALQAAPSRIAEAADRLGVEPAAIVGGRPAFDIRGAHEIAQAIDHPDEVQIMPTHRTLPCPGPKPRACGPAHAMKTFPTAARQQRQAPTRREDPRQAYLQAIEACMAERGVDRIEAAKIVNRKRPHLRTALVSAANRR